MKQLLIDANALTDEFEWCKQQAAECNRKEWDEIITRVSNQPTVDAVPVVRCKDCRWACLAPQRQTATCMKNRLPFTHDYDWFCADGERETANGYGVMAARMLE